MERVSEIEENVGGGIFYLVLGWKCGKLALTINVSRDEC